MKWRCCARPGFAAAGSAQLVLLENVLLLLAGLATGVLAALLAVLPHMFEGGAGIPLAELAIMLGIVLVVGLAAGCVGGTGYAASPRAGGAARRAVGYKLTGRKPVPRLNQQATGPGTNMSKVAFAVAAHPDDIEFLMAGTLMLLGEAGYELHYMNLANGSLGTTQYDTETIVEMRRQEAIAAADSIGATYHESICDDLDIFYDRDTLARLASVMREVAPEILLTHSPVDYMEDHTNACRLAVTAAFARGMPNFPVIPPRQPIAQKVTVYHAQPYSNHDPLRPPGAARLLCRREQLRAAESRRCWPSM